MLYPNDIERKLEQFRKPTHLIPLKQGYWMTEGVQYLMEATYCEWLIRKTLRWLQQSPELRMQKILVFVLKVDLKTHQGKLDVQNEDRHTLKEIRLEFTDFPLPWISLWCKDKVFMLPSEFVHTY